MNHTFDQIIAFLNGSSLKGTIELEKWKLEAEKHRISGLLYQKMLTCIATVPEDLFQEFKSLNKEHRFNTLTQMHVLLEIEAIFSRASIPFIVLKGLLLSLRLYGDVGVRQSGDIDLLIAEENLLTTDRLLREKGYRSSIMSLDASLIGPMIKSHNHLSYVHPTTSQVIELHFSLHLPPLENKTFSELWKNREEIACGGKAFSLLGEHDEMEYLLCHGTKHGWSCLQWIADVIHLWKSQKEIPSFSSLYSRKSQKLFHLLSRRYFPSMVALPPVHCDRTTRHFYHFLSAQIEGKKEISTARILSSWGFYRYWLLWDAKFLQRLYSLFVMRTYREWLPVWIEKKRPMKFFFVCHFFRICSIFGKLIREIAKN